MEVPAKVKSRVSNNSNPKQLNEVPEYQNNKSAVLHVDSQSYENDGFRGRPSLYSEEYESDHSKSSKVDVRAKLRVSLITNLDSTPSLKTKDNKIMKEISEQESNISS